MKKTLSIIIAIVLISLSAFAQSNKAKSLYSKAIQLMQSERYNDAIPLLKKCYNMGVKEYSFAAYTCLGLCLYYNEDFDNAIPYFESILPIYEDEYNRNDLIRDDYLLFLDCISNCYSSLGQEDNALPFLQEALSVREIEFGEDHPDSIESCERLAHCFSELCRYGESVILFEKALSKRIQVNGKASLEYVKTLNHLAECYDEMGDYKKALNLYEEAIEIQDALFGKDNYEKAVLIPNMALCYFHAGDIRLSISLNKEALRINENSQNTNSLSHATLLSNLGLCYSEIGDDNEAIILHKKALEIEEQILGRNHIECAHTLNNIATCYEAMDNLAEAIVILKEVISILEGTIGRDNHLCAIPISNLASCYEDLERYDEALALFEEALNIEITTFGLYHPNVGTLLENLASCYENLGDFNKSVELYNKSLNIAETTGTTIQHKGLLSIALALSFSAINSRDEVISNASSATVLLTKDLEEKFSYLTNYERKLYLDQYRSWFDLDLQKLVHKYPLDPLITTGLNGTLFNKGLLLNTEREFKSLIEESGDREAVEMYDQLRAKRLQIDRLLERPIDERAMDVDSLETVAQDLERQLMSKSKVFGDYTRNLSIDWTQVQARLKKDEAAVEFINFPVGKDSLMYAAYVVRPGMKAPVMVPLFESEQLNAISPSDYYSTPSVSELAWKPLESHLEGVKSVYFAPYGKFYNIAIESVPDWKSDGALVSDRRNYYRVSSTRELAVAKDRNKWKEAATYGGLKYTMDEDKLISDSQKYRDVDGVGHSILFNVADSLDLRAGVSFLPGTLEEALNIKSTMEKASIHTEAYLDTLGTETSFKNLSGKGINVLHIGTHGFFYSQERKPGAAMRLYFRDFDERHSSRNNQEDLSMDRSGLLFSGANYTLRGNRLPEGVDDGILTANELAKIDFRSLDLVVLSACQTGLGEIAGDGVFGLQRGFKKAGANTLLMSLWKVDDTATNLLMTRFFDNLTAGQSKHDALLSAQKYVREYEAVRTKATGELYHPYADPYYWAAFILLDGLD